MEPEITASKVVLALYCTWAAVAQAPPATRQAGKLELHRPIGRDLAPGQVDLFTVDATAGRYFQVVVRKSGVAAVVTVSDPAGATLVRADSPNDAQGPESASGIARWAGTYPIAVSTRDRSSQTGHYEIELTELREQSPDDDLQIRAESKLYAAAAKERAGDRDSRLAAITLYQEAAPVWHRLHQRYTEALCLFRAGASYSEVNQEQKAIDLYRQALALRRAAGDRSGEAGALMAIGISHHRLADHAKALDFYDQALTIRRAEGSRIGEAAALYNMGLIYSAQGDSQKALDAFQQVLAIRRATADRYGEAYMLSAIGNTYRDLGASDIALEYYAQALALQQAMGDRSSAADTLTGFGDVYFFLGDKQKALDNYQKAIELKRAVGERSGEALALIGLGNVYCNLGNKQKGAGPPDNKKGLDYYQQALAIGSAISDPVVNVFGFMGAGVAWSALGDQEKALELINQALAIFEFVRYKPGEGWALYEKSRVERQRGNLQQALSLVTRARDIAESIRAKTISQDLRTSYFAAVHDCYELEVDVLMKLYTTDPEHSPLADAFAAGERARARTLLESLGEAFASIREGADPALLDRERSLRSEISAKDLARIQALATSPFGPAAGELQKAVNALTLQYDEVQAQIRAGNPRYAALVSPQPLRLVEIQQQVLDPETLLLEYSLGEERSFLWVVSTTEIRSTVLPKRSEMENAARRFYDALSSHSPTGREEAGAALSRMLLGNYDLGDKRLLIVADGVLHYVPFAALPDPAGGNQPLLVRHEIVSMPSASIVALLRKEYANRKPAPKALAVFADPVFSRDDARLTRLREKPSATPDRHSVLHRSLGDLGIGGPRLPRLPGTRREALAIAPLVPAADEKQALDFDANRASLTAPDTAQYRILHLGTHGLLNAVHPELSGIVLSLVDRQGKPQDGFVRLHDIYNLKLSADLVVLSACQTGLGKEFRGEGLVGLTRGFMYAGSPRVVASLWQVDDRATAELMQRFYRGMLSDRLPAAAALRSAQLAVRKTKAWEHPYFWAAFTLQGEWR